MSVLLVALDALMRDVDVDILLLAESVNRVLFGQSTNNASSSSSAQPPEVFPMHTTGTSPPAVSPSAAECKGLSVSCPNTMRITEQRERRSWLRRSDQFLF